MKNLNRQPETLVGVVSIGCTAAGGISLIFSILAAAGLNWVGAGICLAAAALSFGLLANALLRS